MTAWHKIYLIFMSKCTEVAGPALVLTVEYCFSFNEMYHRVPRHTKLNVANFQLTSIFAQSRGTMNCFYHYHRSALSWQLNIRFTSVSWENALIRFESINSSRTLQLFSISLILRMHTLYDSRPQECTMSFGAAISQMWRCDVLICTAQSHWLLWIFCSIKPDQDF